ncbi:MAG: translation initiation factor IF-2 [Armatimonadetes bacterium]|nr:translation initiation factor IF-2 [Armatimonadota bacterium]MDW8153502.1 translation initiation factor IF-2 [Armatimonadota bacterium]
MRLYEVVKATGLPLREAVEKLAELGFEVKPNPQAAIPEEALAKLREAFPQLGAAPKDGPQKRVAKKPAPVPPEPAGPKRRIIKRAEEIEREREEQRILAEQAARAAEEARLAEEAARRAAEEAARAAEQAPLEPTSVPPVIVEPRPAPPPEEPKPVPLPERHAEPAVTISPEVLRRVTQPRPEAKRVPPPPPPPLRQPPKPSKRPAPPPPPPPRPHVTSPPTMAEPSPPEVPVLAKEIRLEGPITVGELAQRMGAPASEVVKRLLTMGILAGINQQLPPTTARAVAQSFGVAVVEERRDLRPALQAAKRLQVEAQGEPRPPVVTVMGHVDHGKTTLLDAIRKTNVAAGEYGGITQHIGAYQVSVDGRRITFIDTPGHEAFTTLRARGAQVTDIAVLVVAADDGVMPQTIEALNHARAAGVPILVAINKMDLPGANPDRVKQQLAEQGLVPEEWGGDTIMVPVSARTGQGIQDLLEMILLVAELNDLRADPRKPARGTILEAKLDRGRGPVATVIVQEGTLRVGDPVVAGETYGKVRAMMDDRGNRLQEAGPSTPVEVVGLEEVPTAGDILEVVPDERTAKAIAEERREQRREQERVQIRRGGVEEAAGMVRELRLVVKADVQGSLEAITAALERLSTEEVRVHILHAAVGAVTESDVMLASASDAVVLGFNVRPDGGVRRLAEQEGVEIRLYRLIYEAADDVRQLLAGLRAPVVSEVVLGRAEVRQIFPISRVGTVAGCYVREGKVVRGAQARLVRDGVVVYQGRIASLRRFKEDVREVAAGFECGVLLENFNDVKEGDIIETFEVREERPTS